MPKLFHVRWSAIKAFRRCPKLFEYAWVQNIERRKPVVPLIRGTILGRCLDQLAEDQSPEPVLEEFEREYGKLFRVEQEEYGDIIGECRRIIENYRAHYRNDGLTYLAGADGRRYEIAVETRFDIGDLRVWFTGHIDKLVRDSQGRVLIMDHKSHRRIPEESARYNDQQLVTYLWLLPQSGFGEADGVLWDYLRTKPPTIPMVLKNGSLTKRKDLDTDYDTYMRAIKENGLDPNDYEEYLAPLREIGHNEFFQRVILPTPPKALVENVVHDFKMTIVDMWASMKRNHFTRTMTRECDRCAMYHLCQAELRGLDSEFIRKMDYQEKKDD